MRLNCFFLIASVAAACLGSGFANAQSPVEALVSKVYGERTRSIVESIVVTGNELRQKGDLAKIQPATRQAAHYLDLLQEAQSPTRSPQDRDRINRELDMQIGSFKEATSTIIDVATDVIMRSERIEEILRGARDLGGGLDDPRTTTEVTGLEGALLGRLGFVPRFGWDILLYRPPLPDPRTTRQSLLDDLARSKKSIEQSDKAAMTKKAFAILKVIGGSVLIVADCFGAAETAGAAILSIAGGAGQVVNGADELAT
jgi:hypothetical protein